ncbi:hypothetical protein AB0M28_28670 [Streptomyces sp. NPDC051940]|uniref:hypothetical protein n=1 Tax=Streptomyces sp. NPDC051940 TaxID=3155675 RepID=UPI003435ADD1
MLTGVLIAESLLPGRELAGVPLRLDRLWRTAAPGATDAQPGEWTLLAFSAEDAAADALASALADCLRPEGGWYANFNTPHRAYVVFAGKTFAYGRGDGAGRAEAAAYARSVGVPEGQLDWED